MRLKHSDERSNLSLLRELLHIAQFRPQLAPYLALACPRRSYLISWHAQEAACDVWRLKVLHDHDDGLHEAINKRATLKALIDRHAVNGMIGIVESGRDCDCVEYVHPRAPIPATLLAYNELYRHTSEWADGPFSLQITTPAQAEQVEYESRDLALEAFEDGHPHHITSRFP